MWYDLLADENTTNCLRIFILAKKITTNFPAGPLQLTPSAGAHQLACMLKKNNNNRPTQLPKPKPQRIFTCDAGIHCRRFLCCHHVVVRHCYQQNAHNSGEIICEEGGRKYLSGLWRKDAQTGSLCRKHVNGGKQWTTAPPVWRRRNLNGILEQRLLCTKTTSSTHFRFFLYSGH